MDARPTLSAEIWAAMINQEAAKTVESILAVGQLFIDAKKGLPHGEFGRLFTLTPFTQRMAQRLMLIAKNPVFLNTTVPSHLPAAWSVLDELQRVPVERLSRAIEDGVVTSAMSHAQARRFAASMAPARVVTEPLHLKIKRPERVAKIRELARDGYSIEQMAREIHCSVGWISHIVKDEAIEVPARCAGRQRRFDSNRFVEQVALTAESLTNQSDLLRLSDLDLVRLDLWLGMLNQGARDLRLFIRKLTLFREAHHDGKAADHTDATETHIESLCRENFADSDAGR